MSYSYFKLSYFFTSWTMIAHILFLFSCIPSTFSLAIITLFGGIIFNSFYNDNYDLGIDIAVHYAPVAMFVAMLALGRVNAHGLWRWDVLMWTFLIYFIFMKSQKIDITRVYTHTRDVLN